MHWVIAFPLTLAGTEGETDIKVFVKTLYQPYFNLILLACMQDTT